MEPTNIIVLLGILQNLTVTINEIADKIITAKQQGRDVSEAEVDDARDKARLSLDSLGEALEE